MSATSCWFHHKWGRWDIVKVTTKIWAPSGTGFTPSEEDKQQRQCARCGLREIRGFS